MYKKYLEVEVMCADPVKLISLLYRGALEAVGAARRDLEAGAIRERSRQISKASEIISELLHSLDHTRGGEISRTLAELYVYMQGRLIESNSKQIDAPLAEVEKLLLTLLEGWRGVLSSHAIPLGSQQEAVTHIS